MSSVSVIVPAYNAAAYVGEAIESLQTQTRPPDQIVVVNDGSTDNTAEIIASYCERDTRIEFIERKNGGISAARNSGLRRASGELIAFLDADDRWRPKMLETQLAVMEADRSLVCSFTNFVRFDHKTKQVLGDQFQYYEDLLSLQTRAGAVPHSHIIESDPFVALVARGEIPCFMQTTLFRASRLNDIRFNEALHLGEDYEYALRAYLRGGVAFVTEILADVRRHETNTTKDYHYFPVYKLEALRSIGKEVAGVPRLTAYRDRLVKGHIEAACVLSRRSQFGDAMKVYLAALRVPGSSKRKVKGGVRVALTCLRAARPASLNQGVKEG
jgi:glycosyltransferase involved in cell wall biosynthesis